MKLFAFTLPACVSLFVQGAVLAQEPLPAPLPATIVPTEVHNGPIAGKSLVGHVAPVAAAPVGCPDGNCYQSRCGLFFDFEATFFRYYRTDGRRNGTGVGDDEVRDNAMEFAPRYTLGWMFSPGLGVRARYWDYDQSTPSIQPGFLAVETRVLDFEVFKQIRFNDGFSLEVSGGVRYNDFSETMNDNGEVRTNNFTGLGMVAGLEARQMLASWASIYGKTRLALLVDDKTRSNTGSGAETLYDTPVGMLELGLGIETGWTWRNGSRLYGRVGGEIQNWFNYSSNFDTQDEDFFTGASDVGFVGLVLGIGIDF